MEVIFSVIILLISVYLFLCIQTAAENERFVIMVFGRYAGIKGPGLLFRLPGSGSKWHKISLNESGTYLGDGLAQVNNAIFPAANTGSLNPGDNVKIGSFKNNEISLYKV